MKKDRIPLMRLRKSVPAVMIYGSFLLAMVLTLSQKHNYYVDEMFTYGQANHQGSKEFGIEDGVIYAPALRPFMEFLSVSPEHRFDYANTWRNTASGVHPPLYHSLVHTVCSLFPERFSPWYAGSINIACALMMLYFLRRLGRLFLKDEQQMTVLSLFFVFSAGILSAVSFLRMYVMAMMWVTALTACLAGEAVRPDGGYGFYLKAALIVFLGALTHYYCIVYAVLAVCTLGVYWLLTGRLKRAAALISAMAAAGTASCAIYPAMLRHVFSEYRGKQVLENAGCASDFFFRLKTFLTLTDRELFGCLGMILLASAAVLVVLHFKGQRGDAEVEAAADARSLAKPAWLLLTLPTLLYFLIILKITVTDFNIVRFSGSSVWIDRYMFPVYANLLLVAALMMIRTAEQLKISVGRELPVLCLLMGGMTVSGWFTVGWPYLYRDSVPFLQTVAKAEGAEAVCFYTEKWFAEVMFEEAKGYESIQFCKTDNGNVKRQLLERIRESEAERLVVCVVGATGAEERQALINGVMEASGRLKDCELLGSFGYGTSFLLSIPGH